MDGRRLTGEAMLTYKRLADPVITTPYSGAVVPTSGVKLAWRPVTGAATIRLEVETVDQPRSLTVDLPGSATSYEIHGGFLEPGNEYVFDVKAVAAGGNQSVADVHFNTA